MSFTSGGSRMSRSQKALRVALWTVGIAVVVVVLFTTVFPWVEERQQDPTLGLAPDPPVVVAMGA